MMRSRLAWLAAILLAACAPLPEKEALCPCPPPKPKPVTARYQPTSFDALPGWNREPLEPSLRAFVAGCGRLASSPMADACNAAKQTPADEASARRFFESRFEPYALVPSEGDEAGLITGYYEPLLEASRMRSERYRHPILGVPPDLVIVDLASLHPELRNLRLRGRLDGRRVVPYAPRAEIERASEWPAPVIAWASDPVEVFFLHVQGSGQLRLADGQTLRVGYADQNGQPYRSLGRHLVERGELTLERSSMQDIKAWAAAHPEKVEAALNQNPSYVFFRELPTRDGPIGALGVSLTAGYSLAVDRRFVPLGAPVYLATTDPLSKQPIERLTAAQDTGGAIRGVVRADLFWGSGAAAGEHAGRMRERGRMWLLWPRGAALPNEE